MKLNIAILDDFQGIALKCADWKIVRDACEITVFRENLPFGDALVRRLKSYEVIVAMRERTPFPQSLLERLPRLRLLVTTGMWNRAIDMQAARNCGVVVCGTESSKYAPTELTWALILGLARKLHLEDATMRAGGWQREMGMELHGKTLGVLGLGRLGAEVAGIGKAFGMNTIAWSQNLTTEQAAKSGVQLASKREFFRSADVITIHVVLSERTRSLVSSGEIALMKAEALLINTSRGPVVDENALVSALEEGRIGGAALDVYDIEPLPDSHRLRRTPRTLLTPHVGITTTDNYRMYYTQALEDIAAFLAGMPRRILT